MGGGAGGNFGNTWGSALDTMSDVLAAASLIPGLDTFTNLVSVPVDLARRDYVSAGLSALGVVPFVGEIGDAARLAKTVDKAADAAKVADKAKEVAKSTSVTDNIKSVAKKYGLNKSGYFGAKGKNSRVFKSNDPIKASADFYKKISKGGKQSKLPNGKGVQTIFSDGSRVVYRVKTSTPGSPAVDISISIYSGIKKQKIHFIK